MLLFDEVRNIYGDYSAKVLKNILNLKQKLTKQQNRRIFLLKCRTANLTPNFLKFKVNHITFNSAKYKKEFESKLNKFTSQSLNLLISDTIKDIKFIENQEIKLTEEAERILPNRIIQSFLALQRENIEKLEKKTKYKLKNKFEKLTKNNLENHVQCNTEKWLTNLTDVEFPKEVLEILCLGPNFAIPWKNEKLPIYDVIASVEAAIENKTNEEKTEIREITCRAIQNKQNKQERKNPELQKLEKQIKRTKRFLKENPEVYVTTADKSKKTVILKKKDYQDKMEELLQEKTTYKQLKKNPTAIIQNKNNNMIQQWTNELIIDLKTANSLKIHNALSPKIYGMPKIHKTGIPLRPVVSCIQSPTYKLEKYLAKSLSNIEKSKYSLKDSWELTEQLKHVVIPEGHTMASLDVVSMYTSIPKSLALETINKRWHDIKNHTILPQKQFMDAINFCINSSYFQYKDVFYEQIGGLPMGAPLSAILANLTLEEAEKKVLDANPNNLLFFKRYVDDILVFGTKENIVDTLGKFNKYHQNIKFTMEEEKNNEINYLDMSIRNKEGKIETSWYTKATWSGRYLNFNSHMPKNYKENTIKNIIDRALKLTTPKQRAPKIKKVIQTLKENAYPEDFTKAVIKKQVHKLYNNNRTNKTKIVNEKTVYMAMPYITGTTEMLKKMLKPYNIIVAAKNSNNIKHLFTNLKSKNEKGKTTHVVYKIDCKDCMGKYIGQTKQYLENRIKAHHYSVNNQSQEKTALKNHTNELNHNFNLNIADIQILKKEENEKRRLTYEMLYIKEEKNSINDRKDTENFSVIYNKLLK